jgi:diacylglycerol kinase family enzyme
VQVDTRLIPAIANERDLTTIDDGRIKAVNKVSRATMFRLVPEFLKGTHMRFKQIRMGEFKTFKLSSNLPLYIHADGEIYTSFGSNLHKANFEILPQALRVVRG